MKTLRHSKEKLYELTIEEQARASIQVLALLGFLLFPVFSFLDYFTQRPNFTILSIIRFTTTFLFLGAHLLFRKGYGLGSPILAANILIAIASTSITLMCVVLDGSSSPYYAGVNLVVLAGVVILPTNPRMMAITVLLIIGIYIGGIFLKEGLDVDVRGFVNNLFFLCSTGIIGITAVHFKHRLSREAFFRNLEKGEAQTELATRDGFISMASHELRTPLTSMKLQLDVALLLLRDTGDTQNIVLRSVSNAYRQINNILRLVDEMLDVSRIKSGKFILQKAPTELNELVSEVISRYYSAELENGTLKHLPGAESLIGNWDAFKIEQVIVNLVNNSLKYGEGAEVRVETVLREGFATLSILDKGPGIHPEDHQKIFEKFERGSQSKCGGLGLGLFISREIVSSHGGKILLISSPGEGAHFQVLLPLS